jgi:hypothetical protein
MSRDQSRQMTPTRNPQLEPLEALVGEWTTEATHPAVPGIVVRGQAVFEWLEGEQFLIQRSRNDHPDFPDAIAITGLFGDSLAMHYYDSRGVHRVYRTSFDDGVWSFWRDAPEFSQRFEGTFADGGDTIRGRSQISRDDATWEDDLEITYRRRPP